jgi:hypothetical protein
MAFQLAFRPIWVMPSPTYPDNYSQLHPVRSLLFAPANRPERQ